jgi:hypothetical protein
VRAEAMECCALAGRRARLDAGSCAVAALMWLHAVGIERLGRCLYTGGLYAERRRRATRRATCVGE